jgi:hypothetical protein
LSGTELPSPSSHSSTELNNYHGNLKTQTKDRFPLRNPCPPYSVFPDRFELHHGDAEATVQWPEPAFVPPNAGLVQKFERQFKIGGHFGARWRRTQSSTADFFKEFASVINTVQSISVVKTK